MAEGVLICVESSTSYIDTFRNSYGGNLTVYVNDSIVYNVPANEWVKIKSINSKNYACAYIGGKTIGTPTNLNVRNSGSNTPKKWVYDTNASVTDQDFQGGMTITARLLKVYVPVVTSISVKVGGSSGSTSVTVGEQKEVEVTATYDDGSTSTVTTSASLTRNNTNIEIV